MAIYHTHNLVDTEALSATHRRGQWDDTVEYAHRRLATDEVYTRILLQPVGDKLVGASQAYDQIEFEVSAYEPVDREVYPTNKRIKRQRLWDEGYWCLWEKRYHARHRWGHGDGWKSHRKHQWKGSGRV